MLRMLVKEGTYTSKQSHERIALASNCADSGGHQQLIIHNIVLMFTFHTSQMMQDYTWQSLPRPRLADYFSNIAVLVLVSARL